jgi:N-acetylglucosamine malate deacetylase 1
VRVLAVGAHPDDLVILCAGTLVRYIADGSTVTMVDVTRGDRGSFIHSADEIAAIRERESRRAAEIAGADYVALGLSDGDVFAADRRQREIVVDLIRQVRPDVIISHSPNDYMTDHNEVAQLVFDASFLASLPLLRTSHPAHDLVPPLYRMDTLAGVGFDPVEYVDIGATIETKVAMLEAHESQLTWLRDHDGVEIVDQVRTSARFRGGQCGVAYAEGFVPVLTWLRGRTYRVLP